MPPPKRRTRDGSGTGDTSVNTSSEQTPAKGKSDTSLQMECEDEELSDAQKEFYARKQNEFKEVMEKLEEIARKGAKATLNSDQSFTLRVTETTTTMGPVVTGTTAVSVMGTLTSTQNNIPITTCPPGYRLLMDPKTGRIVGTLPVSSIPSVVTSSSNIVTSTGQIVRPVTSVVQPNRMPISQPRVVNNTRMRTPTPVLRPTVMVPRAPVIQPAPVPGRQLVPVGRPEPVQPARSSPTPARARTPVREQTPGVKVSNPPVVDLTKPGVEPVGAPPLRKAFPALSVQARAQRTIANAGPKRSELDLKVKNLLVNTPAKFTEWLIQQGLVRSEQYDGSGATRMKLKLGMYSDGKRFPYSGGYVWLHEGPGSKYTSVFKGSIFEIGNVAPTVVVKLLYHWSCQTNIPNVASWVKVDNMLIDRLFQVARAVAVAAVQDEVVNMGGPDRVVEIGVISLGTSTQDGARREVRVEVLGVLDRNTRNIRLRASEPIPGSTQQERFAKIFEMLPIWVNKRTKIVTDFSVDKESLHTLGYRSIHQCSLGSVNSSRPEMTNQQVMEYLKKIVPKMFQNTLSNLNNAIIQQFLDELSFREMFGQYPLSCFDSMLSKISAQTQATALKDETMDARIQKIATNPYLDWRYSERPDIPAVNQISSAVQPPKKVGAPAVGAVRVAYPKPADPVMKRSITPEEDADALVAKKIKVSKDLVQLEAYYYATLQGEQEVLASEFKADMAFKCHVCKKVFMNNIEFMKHLHLHVEADRATAIDFADLSQCKYCYKDFDNHFKMEEHFDEVHLRKGCTAVCQICNIVCTIQNRLILHMSRDHVKYEMPYCCQVCGFRTSMHRDIIDHFHELHDRTDKLQCPLCLKTYSLFNEKGYNSGSAVSFMQHLQRHEDCKKKNFNCKKCCLVFLNDQILKTHLEKDHVSFKDFDEVEPYPYVATDDPTMMPKPDERLAKLAPKKSALTKAPVQQAAFAAHNLEDLAMYDLDKDKCCECERSMTQAGHYLAYLCCTKCRYSTCCNKAMTVHVQLFHTKSKAEFDLGKPVLLNEQMYCCCGFTTNSGNKMAKHLGLYGCRSAYPSLEESERAVRDDWSLDSPINKSDLKKKKKTGADSPVPVEKKSKTKPRLKVAVTSKQGSDEDPDDPPPVDDHDDVDAGAVKEDEDERIEGDDVKEDEADVKDEEVDALNEDDDQKDDAAEKEDDDDNDDDVETVNPILKATRQDSDEDPDDPAPVDSMDTD